MSAKLTPNLLTQLAADLGVAEKSVTPRQLSVSGLNQCWQLRTENADYFVKTNQSELSAMLEAEADGLRAIAATGAVAVPAVISTGTADVTAYLLLEHLQFGPSTDRSNEKLGHALASLHSHTEAKFGWFRDNTIGLTPQLNQRNDSWWTFFRDNRLGAQMRLLIAAGVAPGKIADLDRVMERVEVIFSEQRPVPSLVHGDLWAGNWGTLHDGRPCLFDPAVYFGDAETDIAMTRMFGGFSAHFYRAYREIRPDSETGPIRRELYRLYHWLNHWNLFGDAYATQSVQSMRKILQIM